MPRKDNYDHNNLAQKTNRTKYFKPSYRNFETTKSLFLILRKISFVAYHYKFSRKSGVNYVYIPVFECIFFLILILSQLLFEIHLALIIYFADDKTIYDDLLSIFKIFDYIVNESISPDNEQYDGIK